MLTHVTNAAAIQQQRIAAGEWVSSCRSSLRRMLGSEQTDTAAGGVAAEAAAISSSIEHFVWQKDCAHGREYAQQKDVLQLEHRVEQHN
jgi:hypothetical protein